MAMFVSEDPTKGTTTLRSTWRAEIFSEYGDEPEIRVHRSEVTIDTVSEELLRVKKDRVVLRRMEDLPDAQRQLILNFFALCDTLDLEDLQKEKGAEQS